MTVEIDQATPADCASIAHIYNQGIDDRCATFETRHRSADEIARWLDEPYPIVVARDADRVVAFASTSLYRARACYRDIAEFSVYVEREVRGRGIGRRVLSGLVRAARRAGVRKLVSRVFTDNRASRALLVGLGFREVGVYRRHGRLDGVWRDVVIVELLLDDPR